MSSSQASGKKKEKQLGRPGWKSQRSIAKRLARSSPSGHENRFTKSRIRLAGSTVRFMPTS